MYILLKYVFRNIIKNISRSVMILLSLILVSAVFYLTLATNNDVKAGATVLADGVTMGYDMVFFDPMGRSADTESFPEHEREIALRADYVMLGDKQACIISGNIKDVVEEKLIEITERDKSYDPLGDEQIIMLRSSALWLGYELGDTVHTQAGDFVLTAYFESLGVFDFNQPGLIEAFAPSTESEPTDMELSDNLFILDVCDEDALEENLEELREEYEDASIYSISTWSDSGLFVQLTDILFVFSILVALLATYIIYSTQSLMIEYRLPTLITFRSVGTTKVKTDLLLALENIMYSSISSAFGIPLGYLAHRFARETMGLAAPHLFYAQSALLTFVFTNLLSVVVILANVVSKTGKQTLSEMMFPATANAAKPPKAGLFCGIALLAASFLTALYNSSLSMPLLIGELLTDSVGGLLIANPLCSYISVPLAMLVLHLRVRHSSRSLGAIWLGCKNLEVNRINRKSCMLVAAALSIVTVIYFSMGSVSSFYEEYTDNYPFQIIIKNGDDFYRDYSFLNDVEGVDHIIFEYWNYTPSSVNGNQEETVWAASIDGFSGGIKFEDDTAPSLVGNEALVDEFFAKTNGLKVGDTITMTSHYLDESTIEVKLVGVCDSSVANTSRNSFLFNHEFYLESWEGCPALIGVFTEDGADVDVVINSLQNTLAAHTGTYHSVRSVAEFVNADMETARTAVLSIVAIPIFTILIALVGLVDNQLLIFNQRKREYAALSSTSMELSQIGLMLVSELAVTLILGGLLGILLSIWLIKILRDIIAVTILYINVTIRAKEVLIGVGSLLVLTALTSLFPLYKLKKMNVSREIQYE